LRRRRANKKPKQPTWPWDEGSATRTSPEGIREAPKEESGAPPQVSKTGEIELPRRVRRGVHNRPRARKIRKTPRWGNQGKLPPTDGGGNKEREIGLGVA